MDRERARSYPFVAQPGAAPFLVSRAEGAYFYTPDPAQPSGERLRARLEPLASHPHVAELRGRGLLQAVEIVKDRDTLEPFPAEARVTGKIVAAGLAEGVFFYPGGCEPARDVITLGPPFVIGDAEIEAIGSALEAAIESAVRRVLDRSS